MKSLPPPRQSRIRFLRRLLHKLYRIVSFEKLRDPSSGGHSKLIIKRRKLPVYRGSRKYKIKNQKSHRFSSAASHGSEIDPRLPAKRASKERKVVRTIGAFIPGV